MSNDAVRLGPTLRYLIYLLKSQLFCFEYKCQLVNQQVVYMFVERLGLRNKGAIVKKGGSIIHGKLEEALTFT